MVHKTFALLLSAGLIVPGLLYAQTADPTSFTTVRMYSDHAGGTHAREGSTIYVEVETNNPIQVPAVSINGIAMTVEEESPTSFTASHAVTETDDEGTVTLLVEATDLEGADISTTSVTKGSAVIVDRTKPTFTTTTVTSVAREATSPSGTPISYGVPMGEDGLMNVLEATCIPASGTAFMVGTTDVVCQMVDLAGNRSDDTLTFSVEIIDTTDPVITLIGGNVLEVTQGAAFVDPGYSVTDNGWSEFSTSTEGVVDTEVRGTYELTYTVVDGSGNVTSMTRTVSVVGRASSGGGGGGGGGGSFGGSGSSGGGQVLGTSTVAQVAPQGEVLGATAYLFTRHLAQGDYGEEVTELQKLLLELGYMTHPATGFFGPLTASALKAYQEAHGLEAVGYVGPKTLALLNMGTLSHDARVTALLAEIARLKAEIAKLSNT